MLNVESTTRLAGKLHLHSFHTPGAYITGLLTALLGGLIGDQLLCPRPKEIRARPPDFFNNLSVLTSWNSTGRGQVRHLTGTVPLRTHKYNEYYSQAVP